MSTRDSWRITAVLGLTLAFASPRLQAQDAQAAPSDEPQAGAQEDSSSGDATAQEAAASATPEGFLQSESQRRELVQAKRAVLKERAIANARAYRDAGKLAEAQAELERALDLDSEDLEALDLYNEILESLGRAPQTVSAIKRQVELRNQKQAQTILQEAKGNLQQGEDALALGDFETARRAFERVLMAIRWSPYELDWQDLPARAEEGRLRAQQAAIDAREQARLASEQRIVDELRTREELEAQRQLETIRLLLRRAVERFESNAFGEAETVAEEILRLDPHNREARMIADDARAARHKKVRSDYVRERRRTYQKWLADLEETRVPYAEIFRPPSDEYWRKISARTPSVARELAERESASVTRARERLASERIPILDLEDYDLDQITAAFRTILGLPILVDPEVRDEIELAGTRITLRLENVTLENALKNILGIFGPDYTTSFRHDALFITRKEKALGEPIARYHDIRDLTFGITEFHGPKIDKIRLPATGFEEEGASPFGTVGEAVELISPEDLEALIRENIARESWDLPGFSLAVHGGGLIAVTTPEIHAAIESFLQHLRRFAASVVTIETRFLTVTDAFLEQIGIDFRGLGGSPGTLGRIANLDDVTNGLEDNSSQGLDNNGTGNTGGNPSSGIFFNDGTRHDMRIRTENFFENPLGSLLTPTGGASFQVSILDDTKFNIVVHAVEKNADVEVLTEPVLTVFNTQRANITVLNQTSFIQDFDVQVAQTAFIADPSINVIQDGLVLDVRPTISYDRKFITLELQPAVADLLEPIPTFTTSLAGLTQPVTFQLPELRVSSAATTVIVPDGGSVLLGGLKTVRFVDRRATVPILSRIPILSFFASQRGRSEETRNLLVLLRATITDMNDFRTEADQKLASR